MPYRTRSSPPVTIEEFEQIDQPGYRVELSNGQLIREPLAGHAHGRLASRIDYRLRRFVEEHQLGEVYGAETGFILTQPHTVRGPDVAFVSSARIPPDLPATGYFPAPPDLAVEVVSPSSSAADVQSKLMDYLRAGVRLVWIVYPGTRMVVAHSNLSEARLLGDAETLDGGEVLPGFALPVSEIFGS